MIAGDRIFVQGEAAVIDEILDDNAIAIRFEGSDMVFAINASCAETAPPA
jgi:hypothetical protein